MKFCVKNCGIMSDRLSLWCSVLPDFCNYDPSQIYANWDPFCNSHCSWGFLISSFCTYFLRLMIMSNPKGTSLHINDLPSLNTTLSSQLSRPSISCTTWSQMRASFNLPVLLQQSTGQFPLLSSDIHEYPSPYHSSPYQMTVIALQYNCLIFNLYKRNHFQYISNICFLSLFVSL